MLKNKTKIFSILVLLITLLCLCGCSKDNYSFDFNGKTGSKIKGFEVYDYLQSYESNSIVKVKVVSNGHEGNCVKISCSKANDARVYKKINVDPNSYYEISYFVKTDNVTGGAGANVSGVDAQGYAGSLYGTNDWTKVTCYLHTLEDQKDIKISLGLGGYGNIATGVAYFDDLNVKKLSSAPEGETFTITPNASKQKEKTSASPIFKIIFVVFIAGALIYAIFAADRHSKSNFLNKKPLGEDVPTPKKRDIIIIAILTALTAIFSFYNLGSTKGSPDTYWMSGNAGEFVEFSLEKEEKISRFVYFTGIERSNGRYNFEYLNANGEFKKFLSITNEEIEFYKWHEKNLNITAKTFRISVESPGLWLNEVGLYTENEDGSLLQLKIDPSSIVTNAKTDEMTGKPENLFDEQDEVRPYKDYFNSTFFDEVYHPRTAYESIQGWSIYERTHPPLGKDIMSLGIRIFGMSTLGWRFMGTLFGVLLVPLMYLFGLKVFKKSEWATCTALLMMFDCMRESLTRLATIDSYATFFSVAMVYFMYDYFATKSYEKGLNKSLDSLIWSGIMFGVGAATKWTCLYTGGALALVFFVTKACEYIDVKTGRTKIDTKEYFTKNFIPTCLCCVLFFVLIPALIYVLSYIPYMASNPGKSLIKIVLENQKYMFDYHSQLNSTHSYGSPWYTWPLIKRPLFAYVNYDVPEGMRETQSLIGNPAIWWLGVPCFFLSLYFAYRDDDKRMGFFAIVYALQYAPWIIVTRVCFIYHYFTPFVFTIFFIVYVLKTLLEKKIIHKWTVFGYLCIAMVLFIMFYPMTTGNMVNKDYSQSMRWFSTWFF